MEQYALSFLLTSLVMTAVILVVLMFNALFCKSSPARLRYAVWLVVLAGLIIPLRPAIGGGIVNIQPSSSAAAGAVEAAGNNIGTGRSVSVVMACVLIWFIVALLVFTYHMWRYIRFLKLVRRWGASVEDKNILSVFHAVHEEMGLGDKKIELKVCAFVSSSMLTGFLRPIIILPETRFEADELELIFRHELVHYKRRDLLIKLLSVIAISIHWFNPVIYRMCASVHTDGEASCDETVLAVAGKENRQFYAELIIGMIGEKNTTGTLLSTCFYGEKSSIKKRLESIMEPTGKKKYPAAFILTAVAALTVFSGSVFAFSINAAPLPAVTESEVSAAEVIPEPQTPEIVNPELVPETQQPEIVTPETFTPDTSPMPRHGMNSGGNREHGGGHGRNHGHNN